MQQNGQNKYCNTTFKSSKSSNRVDKKPQSGQIPQKIGQKSNMNKSKNRKDKKETQWPNPATSWEIATK